MIAGAKSLIRASVAGTLLCLFATSASAAEFQILRPPTANHPLVFVSGEIEPGDGDRFSETVDSLQSASVVLSGPGGSISEALQIGAEIQIRGFTTMVLPDTECASACGVIWLSGVRRYLSEASFIGFHAAYIVRDGIPHETGMGNAEIGSFLTHLGYGIDAIRFLTAAPPNGLNRLTPDRARALGIDVYENIGLDVITPEQRPSITRLAREASRASAVVQKCGYFLEDGEKDALKARVMGLIRRGHRAFGGDEFGRSMMDDRDRLALEVGGRGFEWCLTESVGIIVEQLRDDPALAGPSFDCDRARTDTEHAVCNDPYLSRIDAMMVEIYSMGMGGDEAAAARLRSSQRDWLRVRNRCGGNLQCLGEAYRTRVVQLSRDGY